MRLQFSPDSTYPCIYLSIFYHHISTVVSNGDVQAFSTLMIDFKADRKIRDHSGKTATSYLKNVVTSTVELKKTIARNYSL